MARRGKKADGRRRGGRKPGTWTLVSPKAIADFRTTHQVSRARLAGTLGVSATSVQNWETGAAIAMPRIQKQLAELFAAGPTALEGGARAGRGGRGGGGGGGGGGGEAVGAVLAAQLGATGEIVGAYVMGHGKMTEAQVVSLIHAVRGALK